MFQFPESDADASNLPPAQPSNAEPRRDKLRHVLYGSLESIDRVIKQLHILNYAEPNDWCDPIPSGKPGQWMAILTKHLLIE